MAKKGKVTIKHYLNKSLKERTSTLSVPSFPVYVMITVKRQNTKFKSTIIDGSTIKIFEDKTHFVHRFKEIEANDIQRIIDWLHPFEREDFTISNFSKIYAKYNSVVSSLRRDIKINEIKSKLHDSPSFAALEDLINWEIEPDEIIMDLSGEVFKETKIYQLRGFQFQQYLDEIDVLTEKVLGNIFEGIFIKAIDVVHIFDENPKRLRWARSIVHPGYNLSNHSDRKMVDSILEHFKDFISSAVKLSSSKN